ncbi:MAG: efflux RND transporter permease subunit [Deltaproteobacteria bacterium]|nr:efflux RND transporter permease subunit [Deltaproteobacteria bacterium]
MSLSSISIRNPVFAWMLMAALILFGGIAMQRLGVSELPDVDFPVVTVHLALPGAAPEVMEMTVVDLVEEAVATIEGIREINSTARLGSATVTVEFDLKRNIDAAVQEVQTKLLQVQARLPVDLEPPTVMKVNPEDQPIMWIALSGTWPVRDLMVYARDQVKDQFQTLAGVGEVFLGGYLDPNLRVWVDADKLIAYDLTMDDVLDAISAGHVERPAGYLTTTQKEYNVRALGEAGSAADFANLPILRRGGQPIYRPIPLAAVARVEEGLSDIRRISRVMGETAVGLGIRKLRGANAVEVAHRVKAQVAALQGRLPDGVKLGVNFDSTRFIEESIGELTFTLLLSSLLTGVVCWLFLGSWSSTVNVLMAIPTSILGTFLVMYFAGFTLNTFTLLGLTLAIGIVVDDAIMVLENIVRHQEAGMPRTRAALVGAKQITFAAVAATLAIIAVFLPVAFMRGVIGKFFFQFGVTMSVAVGLSLLEALTLTPMRCAQFVRTGARRTRIGRAVESTFAALRDRYAAVLTWCLGRRGTVLAAAFLVFALSLATLLGLRKEFVPAQDQSMFLVNLRTPVGSSLEFTDARFRRAEEIVLKLPELARYYAAIGGFGGGEVNNGMMFITLKPRRERRRSQAELMAEVRKSLGAIPDTTVFVQDFSTRGFAAHRGFPIEFAVQGPAWDQLILHAEAIKRQMAADSLFTDVDSSYDAEMPEIQVWPDRTKALARGVPIEAVARAIQAAIGGIRAGKYTEGRRQNDIRVRLEPGDRTTPEQIGRLLVRNTRGERIPLAEVTQTVERPSMLNITRKQLHRAISLFANVAPGKSQADALARVHELARTLPAGYHVVFAGSTSGFQESFEGLQFALWLGIIVAFMILASQFNSYLHPLTILLSLPFSVSGAFLALWLARRSLNIYSLIGIILLMGIVKKNAILLVEFTNQLRRERALAVREALLTACPIRLRPILMTSLATIAAAIPVAIGLGPGAETRVPMALGVIGGVALSTLLTLFVVPSAYSLLARFERPRRPE